MSLPWHQAANLRLMNSPPRSVWICLTTNPSARSVRYICEVALRISSCDFDGTGIANRCTSILGIAGSSSPSTSFSGSGPPSPSNGSSSSRASSIHAGTSGPTSNSGSSFSPSPGVSSPDGQVKAPTSTKRASHPRAPGDGPRSGARWNLPAVSRDNTPAFGGSFCRGCGRSLAAAS